MLFSIGHISSQNIPWQKLETSIKIGDYETSFPIIQAIDTTVLNPFSFARYQLDKSKVLLLNDEHDEAFRLGQNAITILRKTDSLEWLARSFINVYEIASHQQKLQIDKNYYLDEFIRIANKLKTPELLAEKHSRLGTIFLKKGDGEKAISEYNLAIWHAAQNDDLLKRSGIEFNKATAFQYTNIPMKLDSSLFYYKKALPTFITFNHKNYIAYNYANQVRVLDMMNRDEEAKKVRRERDSVKLSGSGNKTKVVYFENEVKFFKSQDQWEEALYYLEKKNQLDSIIDNQSQNNAIASSEVKYQTALKDKERQRNLYIAIALGGSLLAVTIFGFLIYKNTKRKQRIAEQEKALEIQKKEKILKDQELNAIDAMIEGQEKERQRLASDLHDSVGATLAAAKLQFDHLSNNKEKINTMEELFVKTGDLLDQAYTEVRSMAHLKNSGVIAKKGLLPAVEKLAKNASTTDGLQIEVQDFGLTEKLEGSLEISIFRIIQELVTNIIKHAQASEANISITQHEDTIAIIIEDNGRGFNTRLQSINDGMGLSSIEKRIEHLEGSLEVDSTPGRGTNILIDIPL